MCLLSINSVWATILDKNLDAFMAVVNFRVPFLPITPSQRNPWKLITSHQGQDGVGWGGVGCVWGGGDGFLKQKRTYPNHLLDSCGRFWSKHHKTHGKTTSFTCNKKKNLGKLNSTNCSQVYCTFSRRNRQMLSISLSVWSKYQQFLKSKPLSHAWTWRLLLANLLSKSGRIF